MPPDEAAIRLELMRELVAMLIEPRRRLGVPTPSEIQAIGDLIVLRGEIFRLYLLLPEAYRLELAKDERELAERVDRFLPLGRTCASRKPQPDAR